MEDKVYKDINTRLDSIIKRGQEIHNLEVESKRKRQKIYESEIALMKNQHHSELESEIAYLRLLCRLHKLDAAEFQSSNKLLRSELGEIRRQTNEKPKVTKISSEETTKTSDIK